jgi:hypothetical protein
MRVLKVTHLFGFFACFSKRLEAIVWYLNAYKRLPDGVDSSDQFLMYKVTPSDDLTHLYLSDEKKGRNDEEAWHRGNPFCFHHDMQFLSFRTLDFKRLTPLVRRYFTPSTLVEGVLSQYERKYHIDYAATCAVFYRGNDKATETRAATYQSFIEKASEIRRLHPAIRFFVQSDEIGFIEAFQKEFENHFVLEEMPSISKKNSSVAMELPPNERADFGVRFFAATLAVSNCGHIITNSGNCGLWAVLYRGHCERVHQWFDNAWNPERSASLWQKTKRYLIRFHKRYRGWHVLET